MGLKLARLAATLAIPAMPTWRRPNSSSILAIRCGRRHGRRHADRGEGLDRSPTLVFAYTPAEDPAFYAKVSQGFPRHLAKVTGKKVVFFPVKSNAARLETMQPGGSTSPVSTPADSLAVACAASFRSR